MAKRMSKRNKRVSFANFSQEIDKNRIENQPIILDSLYRTEHNLIIVCILILKYTY